MTAIMQGMFHGLEFPIHKPSQQPTGISKQMRAQGNLILL